MIIRSPLAYRENELTSNKLMLLENESQKNPSWQVPIYTVNHEARSEIISLKAGKYIGSCDPSNNLIMHHPLRISHRVEK